MSAHAGPNIIEDGLYSLYDFKNKNCYSGSGSTLFDCVGNQDLTIYGSPTFNNSGYITFANDQVTQYLLNSNYNSPTIYNTFSIWFRTERTDPINGIQTVFTNSSENGSTNNALAHTLDNTTFTWYIKGNAYNYTVPSMQGVWVNMTRTFDSTTGISRVYHNGNYVGQNTGSAEPDPTPSYLTIGQEADGFGTSFSAGQNLDGDFSMLLVYDKALSDEEVAQNFNAVRGRYGI